MFKVNDLIVCCTKDYISKPYQPLVTLGGIYRVIRMQGEMVSIELPGGNSTLVWSYKNFKLYSPLAGYTVDAWVKEASDYVSRR